MRLENVLLRFKFLICGGEIFLCLLPGPGRFFQLEPQLRLHIVGDLLPGGYARTFDGFFELFDLAVQIATFVSPLIPGTLEFFLQFFPVAASVP